MKSNFTLLLSVATLLAHAHSMETAAAEPVPLTNAPSALHNVFRLTPRVFSGSQPAGDDTFRWLAEQGIRTVVSVDGARPDVEGARRHGLRYVHLPTGYDGVTSNRVMQLALLATALPGPFYVHCHHGKHRGPAAAAILCEASEQWSAPQAEAFLQQAGTSRDYHGLYRSVSSFRPPAPDAAASLTNAFPEISPTPDMVQAMVSIDEHTDRLRSCQQNQWRPPPSHPDVSPSHEAVLLWEQLRELARTEDSQRRGPEFGRLMSASEQAAEELRRLLVESTEPAPTPGGRDATFRRLVESCAACHRAHRN